MPSRVVSSLSATGTALTASSTETVLAYVALPAGSFANGKLIRMTGVVRATATNSTDTLTVKAYAHTAAAIASGTALGTSGAVDAADNDTVHFDITFSPWSAAGSTSASIPVYGSMSAVGAEGTVTLRGAYQLLSSIDTTAVQYIGITGKWSTTSASNSCTIEALDVIELC